MGYFIDNLNQDSFSMNLGSNVGFTGYYDYQSHIVSNRAEWIFANCRNYNAPFAVPDCVMSSMDMFYECQNLNAPISIDPHHQNLRALNYMFSNCINFNQDINIPESAIAYGYILNGCSNYTANVNVYATTGTGEPNNYSYAFSYMSGFNGDIRFMDGTHPQNMASAFYGCNNLNRNIQIPDTVNCMYSCFYGCSNFNQAIHMPDNINAADCFCYCGNLNVTVPIPRNSEITYMFANCINLNKPFFVPVCRGSSSFDHIWNSNGLFSSCPSFNSDVVFESGWLGIGSVLGNCRNFNYPISFPEGVENLWATFEDCINLNCVIGLPSTVEVMQSTFSSCYNFNTLLTLPSSLKRMEGTFSYCSRFNQNLQIPVGVEQMYSAFSHCSSLDQNIYIPDTVTYATSCFYDCDNLNQNIHLSANLIDSSYMFSYCDAFNQNIGLPSTLERCVNMFQNCHSLNQNIQIPESVIEVNGMFENCGNLNQHITLPLTNLRNARNVFLNSCNLHIPEVVFGPNCNRIFRACQNTKIRNITIQADVLDFYDLVNGGLFKPIPRRDPLLYSPDVTGLTPAQCDEYGRVVSYGDTLFHINMLNNATVWYNFTQTYYPYRTYNYEYNVEICFHTIEGAGGPSPSNAAWLFGASDGYVSGNFRGIWGPCNYQDYVQNFNSNGTPYFSWAGTYTGTNNCIVYLYWDWANLAPGSEVPPKYTCLLNFI